MRAMQVVKAVTAEWIRTGVAVSATALVGVIAQAQAQAQAPYPTRPVTFIVPAVAGATDNQLRIITNVLATRLGQPFIIENRPGAGTLVGIRSVAQSKPDGYTLLYGTAGLPIVQTYYKNPGVDVRRDLDPVAKTVESVQGLYASVEGPVRSFRELIEQARANPGKLNYGSTGLGGLPHLAMELIKTTAGVDILHVPYVSGAPLMTAGLRNEVQVFSFGASLALPQMQAGRIRMIAVLSAKRSSFFPDVPAVAETYPEIVVANWYGAFAPKGTPQAVIALLNREIRTVLNQPDVAANLTGQGYAIVASTPQELGRYIAEEVDKWTRVVEKSRIVRE